MQRGKPIEFCVLASGSNGNCIYLRSGETEILVDSGISFRELNRRLAGIGRTADSIDALLITHEHNDHIHGVRTITRRHDPELFMSRGTAAAGGFQSVSAGGIANTFKAGQSFKLRNLSVTTFPVPHDASEPVGFTIEDENTRIGIATDLGCISLEVLSGLIGCDAVIVESNHDKTMLMKGPYPQFLKKRVSGPRGHLSNEDAGELLKAVAHDKLKHVVLAHLSETNNTAELSLKSASTALGETAPKANISVGFQRRYGDLIML